MRHLKVIGLKACHFRRPILVRGVGKAHKHQKDKGMNFPIGIITMWPVVERSDTTGKGINNVMFPSEIITERGG